MKKFAQILGEHIEHSGTKQTYIASKSGISYNYLQRLLSGNRHPSDQVVYKLAEALHLSIEQTGELLAVAGYAPPNPLPPASQQDQEKKTETVIHREASEAMNIAQQFYTITRDIAEESQPLFFEEMKHFLGYARYKYVLSGNRDILSLHQTSLHTNLLQKGQYMMQEEQSQLDMIAKIVKELSQENDEATDDSVDEASQPPQAIDDMLSATDRLLGNLLTNQLIPESYQSQVVLQTFNMLRHGTPWEIRRRIVEALPSLFQLDIVEAEHLLEMLRLDFDELRGVDIRRRVIEALPALFAVSPSYLPNIIQLLQQKSGDDIYVTLATIEVCEDIQDQIKRILSENTTPLARIENDVVLLQQGRTDISRIERQLLLNHQGVEKESLQFSIALHNLLCAPDTLHISLREGLATQEMLIKLVAARYLEHLLSFKATETLEMYQILSQKTQPRNIRRTVAKALPQLLHCLNGVSLPARALVRDIISDLATDADLYIRRAVADHAMHIFSIDREFLLVLLRLMHKDTDRVIRYRLQPVALHLAQVWLCWYAETAELVDTHQNRKNFVPSFGE